MPYLGDLTSEQHLALRTSLQQQFLGANDNHISIWPTQFLREFDTIDLSEREVKILNISIGTIMQQIFSLGGELTFHGSVSDSYYMFPTGDKRRLQESLRIRTKNNEHYLTIKQKNTSQTIKERQEREIHLPAVQDYQSLFLGLGLEPLYSREKIRFSYIIPDLKDGDITIDIDLYPGIPPMLELEGNSEQHLFSWIRKLGLEKKKIVNWTARKTLEYYRKKKKRS